MNSVNEEFDPKEGNSNGNENNPAEAMDTPEEVEESNDANIDEDFPGYPHYPAKDDILEPGNSNGKVGIDVENLAPGGRNIHTETTNELFKPADELVNTPFEETLESDEDNDEVVGTSDADLTPDDFVALGERDQDMDMGEDEEIVSTRSLLDKSGYELDAPGTEIDDPNESIGEEDEENNYYSLGGDRHENLENDDHNTF